MQRYCRGREEVRRYVGCSDQIHKPKLEANEELESRRKKQECAEKIFRAFIAVEHVMIEN